MTDEMRDKLRSATRHSLAVVEDALARGDVDCLGRELHSMRGGFALAGMVEAGDACARGERRLAEGGVNALLLDWPEARGVVEAALSRLAGT